MLDITKTIEDFNYNGYFLDKDDLIDLLSNKGFNDFSEIIDFLNDDDNNYISDLISEYSDSKVDIYYYDLRKWSVENYGYIEDAVDEFGTGDKFDFHKAIQMGQYLAYSQEFYEMVSEFKDYIEELDS